MYDPNAGFPGDILIVAPHMDDEILACGGLIARLQDKSRIFILFATDGMRSPAPILPGRDRITPDLGRIRMAESRAAGEVLGLAPENLAFLELPEAELPKNMAALDTGIRKAISAIDPDWVFVPFRFDRHPDHLAVNRVASAALDDGTFHYRLVEYFVYYRWRLLPGKDVRKHIRPETLLAVDIEPVRAKKRKALDCFKSQTTLFYPWQTRPILTSALLDEECSQPEIFMACDPALPGATVFAGPKIWIRIVHRLEPVLQKWKYLAGAFFKRSLKRFFSHA